MPLTLEQAFIVLRYSRSVIAGLYRDMLVASGYAGADPEAIRNAVVVFAERVVEVDKEVLLIIPSSTRE